MRNRAFSLVELLVVIAVLAILAGLLFPVFSRAKAKAKQTTCLSNLRQLGAALGLYMVDYDDRFPQAVDASDKYRPEIWSEFPHFQARIPYLPLLHEALEPYMKSREIFYCPADDGTSVLDNNFPLEFASAPSMHASYGSSYFFRTEIAFRFFAQTDFQLPANANVLFDAAGHWHGSTGRLTKDDLLDAFFAKTGGFRYNVLFGDFHARSCSFNEVQRAWATDL